MKKKLFQSKTDRAQTELTFTQFLGFKNKGGRPDAKFPYFIHNMEINPDGSLIGRRKFMKLIDLPFCHSPFKISDEFYLVASNQNGYDKLYLFDRVNNFLKLLVETGSPNSRFYYCRVDERVFISNRFWNGIYLIDSQEVVSWGPRVSFTLREAKDASEYAFVNAISMPKVENLVLYKGRIFGSQGKRLWFTEALFYEVTYPDYYFEFSEDINLVLTDGAFLVVVTDNHTYSCAPLETESFNLVMRIFDVGGYKGSGFVYKGIPVWINGRGLVVFLDGRPVEYTSDKVSGQFSGEFYAGSLGNSGIVGGDAGNVKFSDSLTIEIIRKTKSE